MEEVEKKYNNFTSFLKEHIKDGSYLSMLSAISVERFLEKIKEHNHQTPAEITSNLCKRCDLDINNYSKETINKFERYIEYFQKVAKVI